MPKDKRLAILTTSPDLDRLDQLAEGRFASNRSHAARLALEIGFIVLSAPETLGINNALQALKAWCNSGGNQDHSQNTTGPGSA